MERVAHHWEWPITNGSYSGPFTVNQLLADDAQALSRALLVHERQGGRSESVVLP